MNNKATAILFGYALSSFASYCYAQNTPLLEYVARYEASANGLEATATRSLKRTDENLYRCLLYTSDAADE